MNQELIDALKKHLSYQEFAGLVSALMFASENHYIESLDSMFSQQYGTFSSEGVDQLKTKLNIP